MQPPHNTVSGHVQRTPTPPVDGPRCTGRPTLGAAGPTPCCVHFRTDSGLSDSSPPAAVDASASGLFVASASHGPSLSAASQSQLSLSSPNPDPRTSENRYDPLSPGYAADDTSDAAPHHRTAAGGSPVPPPVIGGPVREGEFVISVEAENEPAAPPLPPASCALGPASPRRPTAVPRPDDDGASSAASPVSEHLLSNDGAPPALASLARFGRSVPESPPLSPGFRSCAFGAPPQQSASSTWRSGEFPAPLNAAGLRASESMLSVSITALAEYDCETGELSRVNDIDVFYEIGSGAYGTVYAAECPRYDGLLAVKALPRRKTERARGGRRPVIAFDGASTPMAVSPRSAGDSLSPHATPAALHLVHEADVMSRLRHENVVRMHEVIDDPAHDSVYIVMEFVDGKQAGEVSVNSQAAGPAFTCTALAEADQRLVARDVAAALAYCEAQGVVHGDVKPENILLEHAGEGGARCGRDNRGFARAKLTDFGVAVAMNGGATNVSVTLPSALSPLLPGVAAGLVPEAVENAAVRLPSTGATMHPQPTPPPGCHVCSEDPAEFHPAVDLGPSAINGALILLFTDASSVVTDSSPSHPCDTAATTHVGGATPGVAPAPIDADAGALSSLEMSSEAGSPFGVSFAQSIARGTPAFLAPELSTGATARPTAASDAWALGVTLFGLRYGYLPFSGASRSELVAAIAGEEPRFPGLRCAPGSAAFATERRWRSLLRGLLAKEPERRTRAAELLGAPVLAEPPLQE